MRINKSTGQLLGRCAQHANIFGAVENGSDTLDNLVLFTLSNPTKNDGYNWWANPIGLPYLPIGPVAICLKLGMETQTEIFAAARGGSGYGDSQIAMEFREGATPSRPMGRHVMFLSATTCDGHWINVVIFTEYDHPDEVFVFCDGHPSELDWADTEETKNMTEEERAKFRSDMLLSLNKD